VENSLLPLQQPDFPVAVCWSAKSGCTTVLKWFLAQNGLLDEALAYSDWCHSYRQEKLFTSKGYVRQCERLFKNSHRNTYIIRVIRDPASRAVSSFLHFLRFGHALEHWPDAARLTEWKSSVGLSGQQGLSFQQFLLFVTALQLKGTRIDLHFRPQYDAKQDPKVDTCIRLEDLAAGLRAVEARCGLPHVDVEQLSVSSHNNPATARHCWPTHAAAFPADHNTLDELGTPPARAFLDPETRMLIRTAYWTDYEAYGQHYNAAPATTVRIHNADRETTAQDLHRRSRRAA
jgi:hypothetical protein